MAGSVIMIGGREDKSGECRVLNEVAVHVGAGSLVIATAASREAVQQWLEYDRVFADLGVRRRVHLDFGDRESACDGALRTLDDASVIFFTGGDQLRITAKLGGTPTCDRITALHRDGATIAGTSAGASVMAETMLVGGPGDTHRVGAALHMAPGLGFVRNVIVDQHFAQRGRIGRLLATVAQNPKSLGIGIDEDTACVMRDGEFRVLGCGAVYVVDGHDLTGSNISEADADRVMSVFDMRLHVLSDGDRFDLERRRPRAGDAD
jgi:cyanophycinase